MEWAGAAWWEGLKHRDCKRALYALYILLRWSSSYLNDAVKLV
jgi:hypothetical protein